MLQKYALFLILILGACGDISTPDTTTQQPLSTFWTGNRLANYSIPNMPNCVGPRQIEFMKARSLIGNDYYDYAYSDIRGLNAPDGSFGPFVPSNTPILTVQTLFCSQTSNASLGVKMAPLSGGLLPGWIFSTQQMSCRLISYWANKPPTTMFLTMPVGGLMANSTHTSYNLIGDANPSLGWCGNQLVTITD